jgi:hypothetical protein
MREEPAASRHLPSVFIEYDGELPLKVNSSLLSVVLHD